MAKKGNALLEAVKARTAANVVKSRSGGGRTTYLDRFIDVLTEEDGITPTAPKSRLDVIAEISFQILSEELEASGETEQFELTETKDGKYDEMLSEINRKVKSQVANCVADNNNTTSLSYNDAYKDKFEVVKDKDSLSLAVKEPKQD